jgi:CubicO group peptidase (beta-lactamase class C family)
MIPLHRRGFLAGAVSLCTAGCASQPTRPARALPRDAQAEAAIRAYFAPLADSHDLSGVLRIERAGRVAQVAFGYSDWARHQPLDSNTLLAAGSIAKSLVATVLLQLSAEARIELKAPLTRYLPDYRSGSSTTVESVMRHTAGLPRDIPENERANLGDAGLVGWLNAHPPAPSGQAAYSNVGYEVLALVIEAATGTSFRDHAQSRIFAPLQMRHSVLEPRSVNAMSALPHEPGPGPQDVRAAANEYLGPGGQMFASVEDLATWGRAVRDARVLSLRQPDGFWAGSVSARKIRNRDALWMQGGVTGAGATVVSFPGTDTLIVCAFNLASYPQYNADSVLTAIAFNEDPGAAPPRLREVPLTDTHRELSGEYQIPGLGRVRFHEEGGEMRLTVVGPGWSYYLMPASEGRLVLRKFNYTFGARRDAQGRVNGLHARLHMLNESAGDSQIDRL